MDIITSVKEFDLASIIETNIKKNPYQCMICFKRFSRNGHLVKHTRVHSGEKPFECLICGRSFSQSGHLKTHMTIHTGEKPFQCVICGKKFSTHTGRKRHGRVHTGEKPYECDVCQRAFADKWHLKEHLSTHAEEKPFQCPKCLKTFTRKGTLNMHLRTHEEKSWMCGICKTTYYLKRNLNRHFLKFHQDMDPKMCKIALRLYPGAERGLYSLGSESDLLKCRNNLLINADEENISEGIFPVEPEEILPIKRESEDSGIVCSDPVEEDEP